MDKPEARPFYEIEAIKNNWSVRELERQINSLLFERLALSTDKKGLMRLAAKGHEVQKPEDIFKDPIVMEFLGLPESPKLVESTLEQAMINNLQSFLLELGKGFAFVARQERLTLEGDHFYIGVFCTKGRKGIFQKLIDPDRFGCVFRIVILRIDFSQSGTAFQDRAQILQDKLFFELYHFVLLCKKPHIGQFIQEAGEYKGVES